MLILIKFFCFIVALINVFIYFHLNIFLTIAFIIIAASLFVSIIIDFNKTDSLKSTIKESIKDIKDYTIVSNDIDNNSHYNRSNNKFNNDNDININYQKLIAFLLLIFITIFIYDRYDNWKFKYEIKKYYNDIFSEWIK